MSQLPFAGVLPVIDVVHRQVPRASACHLGAGMRPAVQRGEPDTTQIGVCFVSALGKPRFHFFEGLRRVFMRKEGSL